MGFFSKFFGKQGINLDEGLRIHDQIRGDESDAFHDATRLLLEGRHREAIAAFEKIIVAEPGRRAECEAQIGASRFFLGEYEQAIGHYETARNLGADGSMMQDNIDEAREAIANRKR